MNLSNLNNLNEVKKQLSTYNLDNKVEIKDSVIVIDGNTEINKPTTINKDFLKDTLINGSYDGPKTMLSN